MGKKSITSLVLVLILALGTYFLGGEDISEALKILSDKDYAAEICASFIEAE